MIFTCPMCGKGYTIPTYDEMNHKHIDCNCGCNIESFELIGRDIVLPFSLDNQGIIMV
jgi:hypothetical protein